METPLFPRLLITPLIFAELGMVVWYLLYWDLFPKYSIRRLVPWLFFVASFIAIPLLQIFIYRRIASEKKIDDLFVPLVICFESITSVALGFYLLLRRRSQNRGRELK